MPIKLKVWISAFRLRTLPLALSSILVGSALAYSRLQTLRLSVLLLAMATATCLQILSNLANDYGDYQNGADGVGRVGPPRAVQSGAILPRDMLRGIVLTSFVTLVLGIWLIINAFESLEWTYGIVFLGLGLACIVAAIRYTTGTKPYGYAGLGDLSVFVFFGLVGVLGIYFLHTKTLDWAAILPSIVVGCLSVGVLNLNNMRDIHTDLLASKITVPVRLGFKNAKIYHNLLIFTALICYLAYLYLYLNRFEGSIYWQGLGLLVFIPLLMDLIKINAITATPLLDPFLKRTALLTFIFSILFFVNSMVVNAV